jgi:hypothetical protein
MYSAILERNLIPSYFIPEAANGSLIINHQALDAHYSGKILHDFLR